MHGVLPPVFQTEGFVCCDALVEGEGARFAFVSQLSVHTRLHLVM